MILFVQVSSSIRCADQPATRAMAKSGVMNPIAMLVPLVLVRPILSIGEFFRKSGEKQA